MAVGTRAPGDLVANRYRIVSFLGRGGYGEVYAVDDLHQHQRVALKFLRPTGGSPWHEAQILTGLRSEYILPVLNADVEMGVAYLVTELADYGSADSRMHPIGVPPDRAVRWIRHACRGVARTHQAGLLHRDIKPANLFLTAHGEARLGDFGVACLMAPNGLGPPYGTPVTIAPEAVPGGATSIASDVYSLGASLYALLAGRYAHQGPDDNRTYQMVVNDPIPPLRDWAPHVPLALQARVMRAMARSPADRYVTPEEFDRDLGRLPVPPRQWWRTDQHAAQGHLGCWFGVAQGKRDATVCLVPAGKRFEVIAAHQPSGRRIGAACRPPAPLSAVTRNLRAAMLSAT
jgi:serine/threonine-protein kinase